MFPVTDWPPTDEAGHNTQDHSPELPPLSLSVRVATEDNTNSRDQKISTAVDRLIPEAFQRRQGILVIQHASDTYTIQVDPSVPCGAVHERRR